MARITMNGLFVSENSICTASKTSSTLSCSQLSRPSTMTTNLVCCELRLSRHLENNDPITIFPRAPNGDTHLTISFISVTSLFNACWNPSLFSVSSFAMLRCKCRRCEKINARNICAHV